MRVEVPLGGKYELIEVPKGGDQEEYSGEQSSRTKFLWKFKSNPPKFFDKDRKPLPEWDKDVFNKDSNGNFIIGFGDVVVGDTEPLFYQNFIYSPKEKNERLNFLSSEKGNSYTYYDADGNLLGRLWNSNEKDASHMEYRFTTDFVNSKWKSDSDIIYYEEPVKGGRRKRRTNRRKNKNRRTKSRRNRRS